MMWLKIAWGLLRGNLGAIVAAVTGTIGKLSDNDAAKLQTAIGAEKDVAVAGMQASAAAYHDRASLLGGLWVTQWLIAAALFPPIQHAAEVYLDSCPILLWPDFAAWDLSPFNLPLITRHVPGSWHVPAAPGAYAANEFTLIGSLLGIQTAVVGGGSFLKWLHK